MSGQLTCKLNGFKATDIQPFNPNIFTDNDFASAKTTNRLTSQRYINNSNVSQNIHLKEIRTDEINNRSLEIDDLHSLITPNLELNNQTCTSTSILPPSSKSLTQKYKAEKETSIIFDYQHTCRRNVRKQEER